MSERIPAATRVVLAAKALTPPVLWALLKRAKARVRPAPAPEPAPAAAEEPAEPEPPPEWEYVPEGWRRQVRGWDVTAVADAYAAKWPSYLQALEGPGPLGLNHEVPLGEPVDRLDRNAHNTILAYAYVVALATGGRDRLSLLDWGGGLGHYEPLTRTLFPDLALDYHCRELSAMVERAGELLPHVRFSADDSPLERRYDLVLASGSLQYGEDWRELLGALAGSAGPYLYLTRLPVALGAPSFVVLQRAQRYGYETEYLGWVIARAELLEAAAGAGLELVREFLLAAWLTASGAPEAPVEHRGFLFRSAAP